MQYPLPDIEEFIDDELTEGDFKVALTKLHAYLTEAIGRNAENVAATINITATGTGNAVTGISANGSNLTITKGATFVPQTRTIAGHALNEDITLDVTDIGSVGVVSRDNGSRAVGSYMLGRFFKSGSNVSWPDGAAYASYTTTDNTHWSLKPVSIGFKRTTSTYYADSDGGYISGTWRNVSGMAVGVNEIGLFQRIA